MTEKSFFDLPIKNEEEAYEKIIDMSNNDYTTGNLLDFAYYKENYRLIAIDLSKQNKLKDVFHNWKIRRNYFWIFTKFCKHLKRKRL